MARENEHSHPGLALGCSSILLRFYIEQVLFFLPSQTMIEEQPLHFAKFAWPQNGDVEVRSSVYRDVIALLVFETCGIVADY